MHGRVMRIVMLATAMFVVAAVSPAAAQETTAEARTWGGRSLVLTGPWVEVFYTVTPTPWAGEEMAPAGGVPAPPMGTSGGTQREISGALQAGREAVQHGGPHTRDSTAAKRS